MGFSSAGIKPSPISDVYKRQGCHACAKICAHGAPTFGPDNKATIDTDKCVGCARCLAVCPKDAIQCMYDEAPSILNYKIAEYTKAVVDGRPCFHVSLVMDVSPNCDCHGENDVPIVPNVGMFASFDPVALDQACIDAVSYTHLDVYKRQVQGPASHDRYTGLEWVPRFFSLFRWAFRKTTSSSDAWVSTFEEQPEEFDLTIHQCLWHDTCVSCGCPEVCRFFCECDNYAFGDLKKVGFRRTQTLGTGGDCCDFHFYKK